MRFTGIGLLMCVACAGKPVPPEEVTPPAPAAYDQVDRVAFNQVVMALNQPVYWRSDDANPGVLDPDELVTWWNGELVSRARFVSEEGVFTAEFNRLYPQVVAKHLGKRPVPDLAETEIARRLWVEKELAQGRPTLIASDLTNLGEGERSLVNHMLRSAELIDQIYAKQLGSFGLESGLVEGDTASEMLFFRNHGPWCQSPAAQGEADCHALPDRPQQVYGLYPADLQQNADFCDQLDEELLEQFSVVVRGEDGELRAVPYHEAYAEEMGAISVELNLAADALGDDEAALKRYLRAASAAFLDGSWFVADEAWAAMGVRNSKWYVRIGPDETYFEPCNRKAGFHMNLSRINQGSIEWQERLDPVKAEMEQVIAELAGPPYTARKVAFQLPDFIDIVLNVGDARDSLGATIGQSLPNWGPVADAGGRTVAMTNIGTDTDSKAAKRVQLASLFCEATLNEVSDDDTPLLMTTVLHEAAHNLGPSHEYRVDGKTDSEVFGGPLASMLEELKAQTASLYFTGWIGDKEMISPELVRQAQAADLAWTMGKIATGMYTASGRTNAYAQLSAIQVGYLMDQGAITWNPDQTAANGADVGCIEVEADKLSPAIHALAAEVFSIKGGGDVEAAKALRAKYVDDEAKQWAPLWDTITERWRRGQTSSYVYSITLD